MGTEKEEVTFIPRDRSIRSRTKYIAIALLVVIIVILVIGLVVGLGINNSAQSAEGTNISGSGKNKYTADVYSKAAIATDYGPCAVVGNDILKKGGSAVDSAIAALLCLGTCQFQSTGIGGGGFMIVYDRKNKRFEGFDYRETAPGKITESIFNDGKDTNMVGGKAVGVPGEIRGLRAAYKKHGKLEWKALVQPSIELAKYGFPMSKHLHTNMRVEKNKKLLDDPANNFREILYNEDGTQKKEGDILKRPKFAKTLEILSMTPDDMYTGKIAQSFVADVQAKGGIITLEDMKNYNVKIRTPVTAKIGKNTLYTLPLPNGGALLTHIININQGWNFSAKDTSDIEKKILTYHRIVEGFKFSYAYRPYLGDPDHQSNMIEFIKWSNAINSTKAAESNRKKINDSFTQPNSYYAKFFAKTEDHGTTHVSLVAENGDAVAGTDTIDYFCGAKFRSNTTGIIYNNEMSDFFKKSHFETYPWPTANRPGPGKRPLSSTCPSIVVDEDGDVVMVAGASGGTRITLSTAWVMMKKLWFGMDLGEAVVDARPQHSLFPQYIRNDKKFPLAPDVVKGLKKKGHIIKDNEPYAVVQAIYREKNGNVHAMSDPRKNGKTAGY